MNPNINVIKDVSKINSSKSTIDNIINDLKCINNLVLNDFEGNMKFEIVGRINKIINDFYDLEMDFQESKSSLFKLSTAILNEEKRKEKLEEEKKLKEKGN